MSPRWLALACVLAACKGSHDTAPDAPAAPVSTAHSASIAVGSDGVSVFVVNPDADSVSFVDVASHTLLGEVLLAGAHPTVNGSGAYVPAVMPRALALSPDGTTLWVTGQRAGAVYPISNTLNE